MWLFLVLPLGFLILGFLFGASQMDEEEWLYDHENGSEGSLVVKNCFQASLVWYLATDDGRAEFERICLSSSTKKTAAISAPQPKGRL